MANVTPIVKMDCLGEFCPIPTLKARRRLAEMKPGEILEILVDHSCAVQNIQETLGEKNFSFEVKEVTNGIWEIKVKKIN